MRAWFPWESATSLVTVVRRDTVLTDLPYIIKMWKLLNQLPDQGWHRPQLKIADRVAIITFGAEGELLTRLEEMVQQKSKLRTAYSYDAIRIDKRADPQSSKVHRLLQTGAISTYKGSSASTGGREHGRRHRCRSRTST